MGFVVAPPFGAGGSVAGRKTVFFNCGPDGFAGACGAAGFASLGAAGTLPCAT